MSLFVCDECNVVENTATSRYWLRDRDDLAPALCSQCDPETGKWHGIFERKQYDPARDQVRNR